MVCMLKAKEEGSKTHLTIGGTNAMEKVTINKSYTFIVCLPRSCVIVTHHKPDLKVETI